MKQPKLPSLSKVKKALYADWALRVKQADGWKCLLCGCEDNLTAHHWHVCDHHAHAARYCVSNGATLCYACHIRGVHQRADFATVNAVAEAVRERDSFSQADIDICMNAELTTEVLRCLWDGMRARPIYLSEFGVCGEPAKGGKVFAYVSNDRPIAVVGNIVESLCTGRMEVTVVTKTDEGYRYTLRPLEPSK